ncbi:hypothetical protein [Micromonospora psammae]|uniref:hypothetical protein n=1 Tax=Micromonospora sp. CPCC 205556 TaxID=3122398 RepID=UPI002FF1134B
MPDLGWGLDTFGDVPQDDSGTPTSHAAAIPQVVDEPIQVFQRFGAETPGFGTNGTGMKVAQHGRPLRVHLAGPINQEAESE